VKKRVKMFKDVLEFFGLAVPKSRLIHK